MGKGIKGFIFASAVGAALGVLFAPREGKETRRLLSEKTNSIWGEEAQKKGTIMGEVAKTTKTAVEAGQNIFTTAQKSKFNDIKNSATQKGQKIFQDTTSFIEDFSKENIRPVFSEKNEDLRKKIDNARQKISAQVDTSAKDVEEPKKKVKKK